jgi:hypothetical protein
MSDITNNSSEKKPVASRQTLLMLMILGLVGLALASML